MPRTVRVNTKNVKYIEITNEKGTIGIGKPYEEYPEDSNYIVVTSENVYDKITGLGQIKSDLYFDSTVARTVDAIERFLKEKLREVLYPESEGVPDEVAGNNVYSFFPYQFIKSPPTVYIPQETQDAFDALNAISSVQSILDGWISLFNDIVNITDGLSILVEERPLPPTGGGVDTDNGQNTDIVWQTEYVENTYGSIQLSLVANGGLNIKVSDAMYSASVALIDLKTLQFFDEAREYKTVLNFGSDEQYLVQAWRPVGDENYTVQLKLFNALDSNINLFRPAHIGREIANSVVDIINIELPPVVDTTPFLRPRNTNVGKFASNQQIVRDATLDSLGMSTGSVGYITGSSLSYDDRTFNQWFTADFNSSELNIDFSNYTNFVQFSSAAKRLESFKQKLKTIESIGQYASISSSNLSERNRAIERENIKRNFDLYEQFLYYTTEPYAYSASVYYTDTEYEYHATASWPKQPDGTPYSVTSSVATSWYTTQYGIAERYDEYNENGLVKHLPQHIQEDTESTDFITFIKMFGHVMDNLKPYIDQFANIYSTHPSPYKELTMDQVYEVATSFGFELPNAYSLEQLQTFIASSFDTGGSRALVAETWKRFLHSAVYLNKLKGSRTSIDAMMNIYGLNSPLIQLKETAYAAGDNYIKSDELTYALRFVSASNNRIRLPFVSSSVTASSLQIRFVPDIVQSSSLLSGDDKWAIDLIPHPSTSLNSTTYNVNVSGSIKVITDPKFITYGRLNIVSGSSRTLIASSSYFPLFDSDFTLLTLRSQSGEFTLIQNDGDQILYQFSASLNLSSSTWNSTTHIYLGSSGSIKLTNFDGIIDEVRVWGEDLPHDSIIKQAYDPGSYVGSSYSSSYDNLYVDLSFSQPYASITQSATNETVFKSASIVSVLPANGFTTASYERILRTIRQYTPIVGATVYSNRKVNVAPPPQFGQNFINSDGSYQLDRAVSIKALEDKKYIDGQQFISFTVSPADFINQNIMRSMGKDINTNNLIGSPSKIKGERYTEIDSIYNFYLKNYNDSVNAGGFISFYSNLLKAPAEYVNKLLPAKAKLLKGISIESPILDRKRTFTMRKFAVDGETTKTSIDFISGSGSNYNVGAYSFDAIYPLPINTDYSIITRPILQQIGQSIVTSSLLSDNSAYLTLESFIDAEVQPLSSTLPSKLPSGRQFLQHINNSWVSSSLADTNSSFDYVDGDIEVDLTQELSSGYPRLPYLGITNRIGSEENTLAPFYQIEPTSDFNDVGTTTYFHKSNGIYLLPSKVMKYDHQFYRTALDISGEIESPYSYYYANIALLLTSSLADAPGRASVTIKQRTYGSGSQYTGIIRTANILSLFAVEAPAGLRIRLYNSSEGQQTDKTRAFTTLPSISSSVAFDAILDGTPNVFPYTLIQSDNTSLLYFTVDNTTSNDITSAITLNYFEYQPANAIPSGYLPRHYKFNRSTQVAQKRRNYLGCKIVSCPEGCPPDTTPTDTVSPVQITFVGDSDTATVDNPLKGRFNRRGDTTGTSPFSPTDRNTPNTLPNEDIFKFGGGGTLK